MVITFTSCLRINSNGLGCLWSFQWLVSGRTIRRRNNAKGVDTSLKAYIYGIFFVRASISEWKTSAKIGMMKNVCSETTVATTLPRHYKTLGPTAARRFFWLRAAPKWCRQKIEDETRIAPKSPWSDIPSWGASHYRQNTTTATLGDHCGLSQFVPLSQKKSINTPHFSTLIVPHDASQLRIVLPTSLLRNGLLHPHHPQGISPNHRRETRWWRRRLLRHLQDRNR